MAKYDALLKSAKDIRKYFGKPVGVSMKELGEDAYIDLHIKVRIGDLMRLDKAIKTVEGK